MEQDIPIEIKEGEGKKKGEKKGRGEKKEKCELFAILENKKGKKEKGYMFFTLLLP